MKTSADMPSTVINTFMELDEKTALDILWRLTYERNSSVLCQLGLNLSSDKKVFFSDMDHVLKFDLLKKYQEIHPDFLTVFIPDSDECEQALGIFRGTTDSITTKVVVDHCIYTLEHSTEFSKKRILYLLDQSDDHQHFGGLRSLGFSKPEANYLKPMHRNIHFLFSALIDNWFEPAPTPNATNSQS